SPPSVAGEFRAITPREAAAAAVDRAAPELPGHEADAPDDGSDDHGHDSQPDDPGGDDADDEGEDEEEDEDEDEEDEVGEAPDADGATSDKPDARGTNPPGDH